MVQGFPFYDNLAPFHDIRQIVYVPQHLIDQKAFEMLGFLKKFDDKEGQDASLDI